MRHLGFATLIFLTSFSVFAAIPIQQSAFEKRNKYIDSGVFVGGYDRGMQHLLGVRGNYSKSSGVERLVFDLVASGKDSGTERPGFFHVSIQKSQKRILVDLQNVLHDKQTVAKAKKLLKKSHYFSEVNVVEDPLTKNLTFELQMKENARVEVFELAGIGQPGRLVIDVTE